MPDHNFGNIKYAVIPVAGLGTRLLSGLKNGAIGLDDFQSG